MIYMTQIYLLENNKLLKFNLDSDIKITPDEILNNLYTGKYTIPENNIINKNNISGLLFNVFPLFDIEENIVYLVNSDKIYTRIAINNYRFPDNMIIAFLKDKLNRYNDDLTKDLNAPDNYYVLNKIEIITQSIEFLEKLNLEIIKKRFIKIFDEFKESKYKEFTTCLKPSYVNFMSSLPGTTYFNPYYSRIELEKNKIAYQDPDKDLEQDLELCWKNVRRDISYAKIISHKNHILKHNGVGILKYYSLLGSYKMNTYLRELSDSSKYKDTILESIINKFWKIIITAPMFDENFYIYRFLHDDTFLEDLEINDIYSDPGFLSCTRDPYYISTQYNFGKILMKIKVPKNKIGVGLCVELSSNFAPEQEILLAPNTKLQLKKKDDNVKYEHINMDFNIKLKRKYEFEIIIPNQEPEKIKNKTKIETQKIEKIEQIKKLEKKNNIFDIYSDIKQNYLNEINQIDVKIGAEYKRLIIEKINISKPYSMEGYYISHIEKEQEHGQEIIIYYIDTTEGEEELIFFIEIIENGMYVNVNSYNDYTIKKIKDVIPIKDFINFIVKIGQIFNFTEIIMSYDYIGCQCIYKDFKSIIDKDTSILGGNFNNDIYVYFKLKKYLFEKYINQGIVRPEFHFSDLNKYFTQNIEKIIAHSNNIELKQIYNAYVKSQINKNNINISVKDFYIYIIENKCFMAKALETSIALYELEINNDDINIFYNPFFTLYIDKYLEFYK